VQLDSVRYRIATDLDQPAFNSVQSAYAWFLSRYTWDWFATFTFRVSTHPEAARKYYAVWLARLNRCVHGSGWYRSKKSVYWSLAYERHQSGALHMHALLGNPVSDLNTRANRLQFMDFWHSLGSEGNCDTRGGCVSPAKGPGFARIYRANNRYAVSAYVSKYVAKGGEIELGGSLGRLFAS